MVVELGHRVISDYFKIILLQILSSTYWVFQVDQMDVGSIFGTPVGSGIFVQDLFLKIRFLYPFLNYTKIGCILVIV